MKDKPEVFISYNFESSSTFVEELVKKIEEIGIKCFYSERDGDKKISGFEDPLVDAIDNCNVFLFILSQKSNESEHCQNEIKLAFDRVINKAPISIVVYALEKCNKGNFVRYYLCRFHEMNGVIPPQDKRMEELITKIKDKLNYIREYGVSEECSVVENIVYPTSSFLGRDNELELLKEKMCGKRNKTFVVGIGGIGKSELVKQFIINNRSLYDVVVWISFERNLEQTLANDNNLQIKGLSREEFKEESDKEYAQRKLNILKQITTKRVLLVIDNFDVEEDEMLDALLSCDFSLIFTTRYHNINDCSDIVDINSMEDEDLVRLFKINYKRDVSEDEQECIRKIIKLVDGHTLCINLISSSMTHNRIDPRRMLSILGNGEECENNYRGKLIVNNIYSALRKTFDESKLSEREVIYLKNLSLFPIDGVETEKFCEWAGFVNKEDSENCEQYEIAYGTIDKLVEKNWIIIDACSDKIHLHPLISELMQEKLEESEDDIMPLLKNIHDMCLHQLYYKYNEKIYHSSIADYISRHLPKSNSYYYEMIFASGLAFSDCSQTTKARVNFQYCYDHAMETDNKFRNFVRACHYLAQRELLDGHPDKCYDIGIKGYELFKDLDPKLWPDDSGAYCQNVLQRIGEGAKKLGNYEEALKYFKMAEEPCHRYSLTSMPNSSSKNIPHSLGWVYYQIADVLLLMNRLDECEKYINLSIKQFEEINDKWSRSNTLIIQARLYLLRKEFDKALIVNEESIDVLTEYSGKENIGELYMARGDIYYAKGDAKMAVDCYNKAIDLFEKKGFIHLLQEAKEKIADVV